MTTILLKFWKEILVTIILSLLAYFVCNKIYSMGYERASVVYELKIAKYNKAISEKIEKIESTSDLLVTQNIAYRELSRQEFDVIRKSISGKQLYTIVAGKCTPSEDFINTWNDAIKRANQK